MMVTFRAAGRVHKSVGGGGGSSMISYCKVFQKFYLKFESSIFIEIVSISVNKAFIKKKSF